MRVSSFRRRWVAVGGCVAALTVGLAACSGSSSGSDGVSSSATGSAAASRYTTPLKGICPSTVVIQANWWPGLPDGYLYQLLGANPTIDVGKNRVEGPLGATGVRLQVRAGGPATGFQPVTSLLAQDDSILAGYVGTDEAVQASAKQPTVAVLAPYEKSPLALIWGDPAWKFTNVAEIRQSGATVLASPSGTFFPDVFVREGLLTKAQVDTSYQGSPDRFVAADGKIVQQAFVTNEPYLLEHDVKAWGRPVQYHLLQNEYPAYISALAVRPDKVASQRACLAKLVPLLQRAQRDYVADPAPANQLLLRVVSKLNTGGFTLSPGLLAYGNATQKKLGLIADGSDGVLGSFDAARVQTLIGRLGPVFAAKGSAPKPGLTSASLVTNEFLDKTVTLK
ncbi:hypothetical protein [Frankia sp. AgB32]|uniref:hypothetical protein n=1 Tax=Frankia sp. AgB32 TaxID=631119 RepID=UPI00200EC458|nr:hypothetical protein [Frankia sp. AgB32]MCK9896775.1 hypothetical protein [Frankia sp. AgB32]